MLGSWGALPRRNLHRVWPMMEKPPPAMHKALRKLSITDTLSRAIRPRNPAAAAVGLGRVRATTGATRCASRG